MSKKPNINDWKKVALEELKGKNPDELIKKTPEGIRVKPLYTKEDLKNLDHINSMPGIEPYVRGPKATMYTSRPWTVRQYSGFSTASESNKFYQFDYRRPLEENSMRCELPPVMSADGHGAAAGEAVVKEE